MGTDTKEDEKLKALGTDTDSIDGEDHPAVIEINSAGICDTKPSPIVNIE